MSDWLPAAHGRRVATAAFPGYVRLAIAPDDPGKSLMALVDLDPAVAEQLAEWLQDAARRAH
jgi:hypothetical protein